MDRLSCPRCVGAWNGSLGLGRGLNAVTHASFPKEAMVLDEQILTEMALWSWVVFVLWATQHGFR
jgi:hypothetical protein